MAEQALEKKGPLRVQRPSWHRRPAQKSRPAECPATPLLSEPDVDPSVRASSTREASFRRSRARTGWNT
eukprot:8920305-Pyramimonas_sp.AAC.1